MPKLSKQYYYGKNGNKKINCYTITVSKKVVMDSNIKDDDTVKIYAGENKIIIEKEDKNG